MDQRRLAQDSAYAVPRIERGEGILENQLRRQHRLCAIAPRHCVDPPPLEMNFTLARFDQTRHPARERRLSATAFPDDSRSEERRVGKECVSTYKSGGSPSH